jgi:uncharacterized protein (DUF1697 family)
MQTFIIFLRGVMPTGKNRCPMAEVNLLLRHNGFESVQTWIQSGNIVLKSDLDKDELILKTHKLIKENIGADLPVIALTCPELQTILNECPYSDDTTHQMFTLFASEPDDALLKKLNEVDFSPDKLVITKHCAYIYIPRKWNDSKINNGLIERRLKVVATTRTYGTVAKMLELSKNKDSED